MIPGSMGMAFEHADGSNTIVIRHELWGLEGREPLRAVAHEALHVANRQRGEHLYRLGERFEHLDVTDRHFLSYAGILIEEYRVDRALCSHGQWGGDRDLGDFD
jgi:hypothetical protein